MLTIFHIYLNRILLFVQFFGLEDKTFEHFEHRTSIKYYNITQRDGFSSGCVPEIFCQKTHSRTSVEAIINLDMCTLFIVSRNSTTKASMSFSSYWLLFKSS